VQAHELAEGTPRILMFSTELKTTGAAPPRDNADIAADKATRGVRRD